ncbi:nucleotidyl transferase AbiEii/AbiGii toxin family protein [Sphingosinicella humi]|uniref:Nucleotidyl transferase AbiEii/AbiGii toxin family protein n=1 Tax=Allosphingosinicella humi TaxID=2068657 RepID=A0A2U2J0S6_9SPHN|nr:nucleotidyl transferase AbiEii/AbiGii toxin family protein [Sphingosinicella humi]PWG01946.1 hypothetical protein DF286_02990 [Sphingosinicella humi]
MSVQRPSQWALLFDLALGIIDNARTAVDHDFLWSFGGGTALMLQIHHRESHDIDLFIDDPQILPFLNPATQDYKLSRQPDDYDTDGAQVTKLIFQDIGEIDFICCADVTNTPSKKAMVRDREVDLETPAEIVAKKVYYRGSRLQPRDMFDIAAVAESLGADHVKHALKQCGADRLAAAQAVARAMDPMLAQRIIDQLMFREHTRHLVQKAQSITEGLLKGAAA